MEEVAGIEDIAANETGASVENECQVHGIGLEIEACLAFSDGKGDIEEWTSVYVERRADDLRQ